MGHDSYIWEIPHSYGTWLVRTWHDTLMSRRVHDSFVRDSHLTWPIHMTHFVTLLMRVCFVCDMTYSDVLCMWHDSIIFFWYVTWLILSAARPLAPFFSSTPFLWADAPPVWAMTQSHMTCLICIRNTAFGRAVYVTWLMCMCFVCDMTYSDGLCMWHDSIIYVLYVK